MQTTQHDRIKPTLSRALHLARQGQVKEASALLDGLALQAPNSPEIHYHRAKMAALLGDAGKRQTAIDTALALAPNEPAILAEAIQTHTALENHADVLALLDRQIAQDPKAVKPQAEKALYLQRAGDFAASEKLFRKLLRKHGTDAELYRMFAATHRFKPNDPLIGAMRRLAKHPRLSQNGTVQINYALAKAMEDTRNHAKVFPHLRRANAAQAALWPDDAAARDHEWDAVLSAQTGLTPPEDAPQTHPRMIFVTGLPRSGTTLVEQIIASHSQVHAGGELATALRTAFAQFGTGAEMTRIADRDPRDVQRFAAELSRFNQSHNAANAACLTDKSIMAFLIYGLLHSALPNARFIIVHRDPRDIAVSIYKNHFSGGTHRYATDLAAIAGVIKHFRRIVSHWRSVLPDRLTEIRYEDLVADPVSGPRTLIAAAGLDWEDQCLDFHKSGGTVKTLSLHQVRQPIYQSSAQAWRRYETELQPFFDAWGDTEWD